MTLHLIFLLSCSLSVIWTRFKFGLQPFSWEEFPFLILSWKDSNTNTPSNYKTLQLDLGLASSLILEKDLDKAGHPAYSRRRFLQYLKSYQIKLVIQLFLGERFSKDSPTHCFVSLFSGGIPDSQAAEDRDYGIDEQQLWPVQLGVSGGLKPLLARNLLWYLNTTYNLHFSL